MNNAARHALGLVAGVVAAPVVLVLWCYGTMDVARGYQTQFGASAPGLAALAAGAVALGVLCGSRVSPLGSLVPALVFLGFGALWAVDPYMASRHAFDLLPEDLRLGLLTLSSTGIALGVGVLLLVASVPVSRWRVMQKPPPVPYPQLPFATPAPGQAAPGQGLPGQPAAGGTPPPGDAPQPPPLPYQPGR